MRDVFVGLFAIAVGLLFAFRGYIAMRLIIPIWGAFGGFLLGAGIVAGTSDAGFLRSAAAWLVGLALALVFFALAYLYFEVSIVLAMGGIGFALGTGLMTALGVSWSWIVTLVGVGVGVLLAVVAVVGDLPAVILVVLTALGGASAAVFGLMMLFGTISTSDLESTTLTERINDSWWWWTIYAAIAVVGIVVQSRLSAALTASARSQWASGQRAQGAT